MKTLNFSRNVLVVALLVAVGQASAGEWSTNPLWWVELPARIPAGALHKLVKKVHGTSLYKQVAARAWGLVDSEMGKAEFRAIKDLPGKVNADGAVTERAVKKGEVLAKGTPGKGFGKLVWGGVSISRYAVHTGWLIATALICKAAKSMYNKYTANNDNSTEENGGTQEDVQPEYNNEEQPVEKKTQEEVVAE